MYIPRKQSVIRVIKNENLPDFVVCFYVVRGSVPDADDIFASAYAGNIIPVEGMLILVLILISN